MECAFNTGKRCIALVNQRCKNCSFHKTQSQLTNGRKLAKNRIISLPEDLKVHITNKYYGGRI